MEGLPVLLVDAMVFPLTVALIVKKASVASKWKDR